MGVILCPEHGRAGIALVCPHLATNTDRTPTRLQIDLSGFKWPHWFCSDCLKQFGLPEFETDLPETAVESYQDAFAALRPVCGVCFTKQYEAKTG